MIPNVGQFDPAKGGGLQETAAYILQAQSNEDRKAGNRSHDRVGWVEKFHLDGVADGDAGRVMQETADRADDLKRAAGVRRSGRPATTPPVYHYSIKQHPDEPPLTKAEWLKLIQRINTGLGIPDGHQTLVAFHTDTETPHPHVLINKVNSITGRRFNIKDDLKKIQAICDDFDRERGLNFTPYRREKNDILRARAASHPDPSKRNRRKAVPKKPHKPSWAESAAMDAVEGCEWDDFLEERRIELLEFERDTHREQKEKMDDEWKALKAARKAIYDDYRTTRKEVLAMTPPSEFEDNGKDMLGDAFRGWLGRGPTAARERQRKQMWRTFLDNEKTFAGRLSNAILLAGFARANGGNLKTMDLLFGSAAADLRKDLMQQRGAAFNRQTKQMLMQYQPARVRNFEAQKAVLLAAAKQQRDTQLATFKAENPTTWLEHKSQWDEGRKEFFKEQRKHWKQWARDVLAASGNAPDHEVQQHKKPRQYSTNRPTKGASIGR